MTKDPKKPLPRQSPHDEERAAEAKRVSRLLDEESGQSSELEPEDPSLVDVYGMPPEADEPVEREPAPVYGLPSDREFAEPPAPAPSEARGTRFIMTVLVVVALVAAAAWYFSR